MKKYYRIIFEIVIIFVAMLYYLFKIFIPEYKNSIGSSEKLLFKNDYVNYIEVKIDNNVDFAFLINDSGVVFHMFFFDNNASNLYNRNIEDKEIDVAIKMIFDILKAQELYNSSSKIIIYHTSNNMYLDVLNALKKYNNNIIEYKIDLKEKALEYSIQDEDDKKILFTLDIYSKELATNNTKSTFLGNNKWSFYSDEIYEKLDKYIKSNNIENLRKDDVNYPISLIPDDSMTYYPTTNSWYYVEDGRVYAYIEFKSNNMFYRYCYMGSIDDRTKGACD